MLSDDVRRALRVYPDFPSRGIFFQDIAPLLGDPTLLGRVVEAMAAPHAGKVDKVAGIESRGFILGVPIAMRLGAGFVPIRKAGKLPGETLREDYRLEYGAAALEMQCDAVRAGERVLIVDDVLATGGTANAARRLVRQVGAEVSGHAFLLEIGALDGRLALDGPAHVLLKV